MDNNFVFIVKMYFTFLYFKGKPKSWRDPERSRTFWISPDFWFAFDVHFKHIFLGEGVKRWCLCSKKVKTYILYQSLIANYAICCQSWGVLMFVVWVLESVLGCISIEAWDFLYLNLSGKREWRKHFAFLLENLSHLLKLISVQINVIRRRSSLIEMHCTLSFPSLSRCGSDTCHLSSLPILDESAQQEKHFLTHFNAALTSVMKLASQYILF